MNLDKKVGTLTPAKEADIVLLNATAMNFAPLNHAPDAVVTLMNRHNVDAVLIAGKVRKWKGKQLDIDLAKMRGELEEGRDYLFDRGGIAQDLFRA